MWCRKLENAVPTPARPPPACMPNAHHVVCTCFVLFFIFKIDLDRSSIVLVLNMVRLFDSVPDKPRRHARLVFLCGLLCLAVLTVARSWWEAPSFASAEGVSTADDAPPQSPPLASTCLPPHHPDGLFHGLSHDGAPADLLAVAVIGCVKFQASLHASIARWGGVPLRRGGVPAVVVGFVGGGSGSGPPCCDPATRVCTLPVPDTYEALPAKVHAAFSLLASALPTLFGVVKTDEDLGWASSYRSKLAGALAGVADSHPYWGNNQLRRPAGFLSDLALTKWSVRPPAPVPHPPSVFATGPLYYVSAASVKILLQHPAPFQLPGSEDILVGAVLNEAGIQPGRPRSPLRVFSKRDDARWSKVKIAKGKSRRKKRALPVRSPGSIPDCPSSCLNRTLTVAVANTWGGTVVMLQDVGWLLQQPLLEAAARILKVPVTALVTSLSPHPTRSGAPPPDLLLLSCHGKRRSAVDAARAHRGVSVFINFENTAPGSSLFQTYADELVGVATLVFGVRRWPTGGVPRNYLRTPTWLPTVLSRDAGACAVWPDDVKAAVPAKLAAAAWAARPHFASLISKYKAWPRIPMWESLVAAKLGDVHAHGPAFHNAPWPAGLPNTPAGKQTLLKDYRVSVCPENSRLNAVPKRYDGAFKVPPIGVGYGPNATGYVSEKLLQALRAGAVPLYWGDSPVEPGVINDARVLHWGDAGVDAMRTLRAINSSVAAREAFFAQPVLLPGAQAWLEGWCADAGEMLARALLDRCGCQ